MCMWILCKSSTLLFDTVLSVVTGTVLFLLW